MDGWAVVGAGGALPCGVGGTVRTIVGDKVVITGCGVVGARVDGGSSVVVGAYVKRLLGCIVGDAVGTTTVEAAARVRLQAAYK